MEIQEPNLDHIEDPKVRAGIYAAWKAAVTVLLDTHIRHQQTLRRERVFYSVVGLVLGIALGLLLGGL